MNKPIQIKAHNGVRNDVSSERFSEKDLLTGNNVDIDETGKLFRRLGTTQVSAGDTTSLWSDKKRAMFVRSGTLYEMYPDLSTRSVMTGVGKRVAYGSLGNTVYWTDGKQAGRVEDGKNMQWGIEVPRASYYITETLGDMPEGFYGVTLVYVRNRMESGAPRAEYMELFSTGGISITNIPQPASSDVDSIAIYMTLPDGESLYRAAVLSVGTTSVTIRDVPSAELPLRTQFKGPAPAGQLVGFYAGRAYVAQGNVLWYSEPFEYELFDYQNNYIMFEENVTIFAPVTNGVFVATETETVFLQGREPSEFVSTTALPYGGVLGTLVYARGSFVTSEGVPGTVPMWTNTMGVCAGTDSGQVIQLTSNRYIMPAVQKGSGLVKVRGGTPQYLSTLYS